MKDGVLNLTYASSLTNLCEVNSSFDSGILRIAYAGKNRNGSSISKQTFEKCIRTIYNCPVVCNYDRESDTLGGHDMELVHGGDGSFRLVNLTHPVGVIPQGARVYWETVDEEDGSTHEYLCAEALIWKRQEAYRKIKDDGICAQSMEITVKDGKMIDGVYHVYDFEFTAFALIGVTPCFEAASLAFTKQDFKRQLSEMMHELKESFTTVTPSNEDDNIHSQKYSTKGGRTSLDKNELIAKYGIDVSSLDFSVEDFSAEELEEKFKAMSNTAPAEGSGQDKFALTSNIVEEICLQLSAEKVQREWGESSRYCYVDCDFEAMEVYCWDTNDWLLYGFPYKTNGDHINIDYACRKRKKYVVADFDEGEQDSPFAYTLGQFEEKFHDSISENTAVKEKYQAASDTIASMEKELGELRQFKAATEHAIAENERKSEAGRIFAQFEDLSGVEAFEALKTEYDADCMKYEADALEEKCFAIRGRQGSASLKFSAPQKTPKLPIDRAGGVNKEPYGGVFEEYGFSAKE
jgi:hypothetical protein